MGDHDRDREPGRSGFSRRDLLRGGAAGAVVGGVLPQALRGETEAADTVSGTELVGPGPVPMTFTINGRPLEAKLEPRVTLLDALRNHLDLTGAKKVCDRATCGACTVLIDGQAGVLLHAARDRSAGAETSRPSKGWARRPQMHPIQAAFVEHDAQQCGYCTPGLRDRLQGVPRRQPESDARADPARPRRQPLPLRHLRRHQAGAARRRQAWRDVPRRRRGGSQWPTTAGPTPPTRSLIGKPLSRLDGPAKSTGAAKYPSDLRRDGMLYAKVLTCPHAHARIKKIDVAKAKAMPGVSAVRVIQDVGTEIQWAFDEVAAVAAATEEIARDAVRAIEVEYEVLPHYVLEGDRSKAPETKPGREQTVGDPDGAYASAAVKVERTLAVPMINHCLPRAARQRRRVERRPAHLVRLDPGGLDPRRPVRRAARDPRLQRAREDRLHGRRLRLQVPGRSLGHRGGATRARSAARRSSSSSSATTSSRSPAAAPRRGRPSRPAPIADGNVVAWISDSWGSGGLPGTGTTPLPYVFEPANRRHVHTSVPTNFAGSRAWRAPNHPQAAFLTMSVMEDLAAELGMDPLDFFRKNLPIATGKRQPGLRAGARDRRRSDGLEAELEAARRRDRHRAARARPLDPHLGRPRPRVELPGEGASRRHRRGGDRHRRTSAPAPAP